jgi:hypothetical protein
LCVTERRRQSEWWNKGRERDRSGK